MFGLYSIAIFLLSFAQFLLCTPLAAFLCCSPSLSLQSLYLFFCEYSLLQAFKCSSHTSLQWHTLIKFIIDLQLQSQSPTPNKTYALDLFSQLVELDRL